MTADYLESTISGGHRPPLQVSDFETGTPASQHRQEKRGNMRNVVLTVMLGIAIIPAMSQTARQRPAFEVASVKPNTAPEGNANIGDQPGGRFIASRIP